MMKLEESLFTILFRFISSLRFKKLKEFIFTKVADSCLIIGKTDNPKPKYGYAVFSKTDTLKKLSNIS